MAILNLAFWVLGFIPFFVSWGGVYFLPAPDSFLPIPAWSHWLIGGLLALPFGLFLSILAFTGFSWEDKGALFLGIFSAPFSLFMTGFFVNMTLGGTIPMIHTALYGEAGYIEYRVVRPYGGTYHGQKGCYSAIEVKTDVFGLSELCGFEYKGGQNLYKGTKIEVSGKASRAGVFYDGYRVVPD